jgi:uncharacterized membrane protein
MEGQGTPPPEDDANQGEAAPLSDDVLPVSVEPALRPVAESLTQAGVPPEKQITIIQEVRTAISMHSGPLPSPATLQEYSGAVENGAERIVTRWEDASRHNESLERMVVETNLRNATRAQELEGRGQLIAGGLVVFLAICGLICTLTGHNPVAITIFATTVIGVASVFIVKGITQTSEQKEERQTVDPRSGNKSPSDG